MRVLRCVAAVLLVASACVVGVTGGAGPARAIDSGRGYAGFCKSDKGVTVVIDFQQLGGRTIVRCNPRSTRGTGLEALEGAGIQVAGVQRWGKAFICRVENRPSAVETVAVRGNTDYKERCIDTPPASAYWSYWHAGNNCSWKYSQWGVKNRDFVPGGFEGWSFSLNATAETNPRPRIAAVRPGTAGDRCVEPKEHTPTTNDPNERQPGSTADDGYVPDADYGKDGRVSDDPFDPDNPKGSKGTSAGSKGLPAPRPRATNTAADPADNVAWTGGDDAPDVTDVLKEQANASAIAPWAAAGAIVVLVVVATWTARRRRRMHDQ